MSEYLIKKAVLEWLKEQQKQQEENRDRLEIDHPYWEYHEGASDYLSLSVEKIQSGAFDAEQTCTQENPCPECLKASVDGYKLIESELNAEVQRLRAAFERIVTVYEECDCTAKDLYLIAVNEVGSKQQKVANEVHEALSTTNEQAKRVREHDWVSTPVDANDLIGDLIGERCPKCGADMLGNKVGDKWCSLGGCDYSINAPEKVGTEEWRHKYFGAEWPKVEGDGNDA